MENYYNHSLVLILPESSRYVSKYLHPVISGIKRKHIVFQMGPYFLGGCGNFNELVEKRKQKKIYFKPCL
jgi:hypothetical protein